VHHPAKVESSQGDQGFKSPRLRHKTPNQRLDSEAARFGILGRFGRTRDVSVPVVSRLILSGFCVAEATHEITPLSFAEDVRVDLQNSAWIVAEVFGRFVDRSPQPESCRGRVVASSFGPDFTLAR
jgi:hypothetical protein